MSFNYQFKIRTLVRDQLKLDPNSNFTLQVLEYDDSPPYIATDRVELTFNNKVSDKPFIIVGKGWLLDKLYAEAAESVDYYMSKKIRIEYIK